MSGKTQGLIGSRVPKIDAWEKVTGTARYGHDITLPGMLHARILRSAHPHARLLAIDTRAARRVPGVKVVLTGDGVTCANLGLMQDHPPLKSGKVRSIRDEIAAVAATSEEAAEEACRLIKVQYEPLPAVFDPLEAMKRGAPRIHDKVKGNLLSFNYRFSSGDVDSALSRSAHVVEGTYTTRFVTHACMEPCFALASWDPQGRLLLHSTTQIPYLLQGHMAKVLGIPGSAIRIKQPVIGGAFGSKLDTYPYEVITALLAREAGRPVRLLYSREEEFVCSPTRQPMIIKMATGCDADGKLTARRCEVILDNGAYTSWGITTPHIMLLGITSLYRVENVLLTAQSVYTNNPTSGAFRGYGNPQGTFANEQQMEALAHKAGIDPVEFRLLNCNQPHSVTPQKFRITTCALRECIETCRDSIDFKAPKEGLEGVGMASMFHVAGGGRVYKSDGCGVIAKLDDFARLTLMTGATEIGTGSDTAMAMIAAEELGLPVENVSVINNDTDVGPWDVGIHASRTTFIAGNATILAARDIKAQLAPHAAEKLGCTEEELEWFGGAIRVTGDHDRSIPIDKVVRSLHFREQGKMVVGKGFYDPPNEFQARDMTGNVSSTYAFATHACRVRVDPETGRITVLKFVAAHDVGRVINPLGLDGQIEGAIAQGLGMALTEQVRLDQGRMQNTSFLDYKLLMARDMPRDIELHYIETNDPEGPYGAKGVSEAGIIPIPAAIANAVADAIRVRIHDLPLTPERVLEAIKSKP
ncbi:MAG: xanthine dehydrogenase family protein [Deltaproteobacteria bacterium]|nr:xanthine dehydrogenase family protein [Deltaproteobacteria bacterium]